MSAYLYSPSKLIVLVCIAMLIGIGKLFSLVVNNNVNCVHVVSEMGLAVFVLCQNKVLSSVTSGTIVLWSFGVSEKVNRGHMVPVLR